MLEFSTLPFCVVTHHFQHLYAIEVRKTHVIADQLRAGQITVARIKNKRVQVTLARGHGRRTSGDTAAHNNQIILHPVY
jgi:hypothetical protein